MKTGTKYDTGKSSWTYGTAISWFPNRNVERELLGPCPACGSKTVNYGGSFSCCETYCSNSSSMFACSPEPFPDWWNTDILVELDGNSWCAHSDDFINLQESIAGFGDTPRDAVADYRKNKDY